MVIEIVTVPHTVVSQAGSETNLMKNKYDVRDSTGQDNGRSTLLQ
jgi:hypothetical protein